MTKEQIIESTNITKESLVVGSFKKFSEGCDYFVETGANYGKGIHKAIAIERFEKFFTCELDSKKYEHCVNEFKEFDEIKIYKGFSTEALKEILPQIDKRCFFYLDAHDDGGGMPTFEELDLIRDHHIKNHNILVDDIPIYFSGDKKQQLINKILSINPNYVFEGYTTVRPDYQLGAYIKD